MTLPLLKRFQPHRYRPGGLGNWSGHLPFAHDLVATLRPNLLVELGTHYGESYFGFCQAVSENGLTCRCYAVDTWRGDPHSGFYDESVFQEIKTYNAARYGSFSTLLRTTFEEANGQFGNQTIDILHIDGLHTYEAVKHDFDEWFPKVRPGGVILLHDTGARHADFEVWRLWNELSRQYPSFEFSHSWGLGVLRRPDGECEADFLRMLFYGSDAERAFLQHYYSLTADALAWEHRSDFGQTGKSAVRLQVFPFLRGGYNEASSVIVPLELNRWELHTIELPQGSGFGRIRIDPVDVPALVEVRGIVLRRAIDKALLGSWTRPCEILTLFCDGSFIPAPSTDPAALIAAGADPQLLLPEFDRALLDQPLSLEISLRASWDIASAIESLLDAKGQLIKESIEREMSESLSRAEALRKQTELNRDQAVASLESIQHELHRVANEKRDVESSRDHAIQMADALRLELRSSQIERLAAVAEYKRAHSAQHALLAQLDDVHRATTRERDNCIKLEEEFKAFRAQSERQLNVFRNALEAERLARQDIHKSLSWRITAPLRTLYDFILALRP